MKYRKEREGQAKRGRKDPRKGGGGIVVIKGEKVDVSGSLSSPSQNEAFFSSWVPLSMQP